MRLNSRVRTSPGYFPACSPGLDEAEMLKQLRRFALLVASVTTLTASAHADTPYFVPGDAFFHSHADESPLEDGGSPPLVYEYMTSPLGQKGFTNFFGIREMEFRERSSLLSNITHACRIIRTSTRRRERIQLGTATKPNVSRYTENPIHLFFYNDSFSIKERAPFLKYNERWAEEFEAVGGQRRRYDDTRFFSDIEGNDRRDATEVAPFEFVNVVEQSRIIVDGKKMICIVLSEESLVDNSVIDCNTFPVKSLAPTEVDLYVCSMTGVTKMAGAAECWEVVEADNVPK